MLLLTTLPYLVAWQQVPAGHVFTWILPPYPEDGLAYQAWVRQALDGHLLFQLKYTAQPHAPFLFQPFFLVAGLLARLTGGSPGLVLLVLKCAGVILFLQIFFNFTAFLRLPRAQAQLAAVLLGVSSGLGALCAWTIGVDALAPVLGNRPPADLWLVDLTTWWALEWNPLFPYSLALILGAVQAIWAGFRRPRWGIGLLAGGLVALLTFVHPYHIPFLYGFQLLLCALWWRRASWRMVLPFFAVSLPVVAFSAWQSAQLPLLAQHAITGRMESPPVLSLLLGLGLPLALAVAGLRLDVRRLKAHAPLVLWIALALVLAYAPLWFQRKLVFGLQIPLCIWAAWGLSRGVRPHALAGLLAACAVTTPVYLLAVQFHGLRADGGPGSAYEIDNDLAAALDYLRDHTRRDETVIATYETSRLIPARSGNTAIWGHWAQSVDQAERREQMQVALTPDPRRTGAERAAAFWNSGARLVLVDPLLRARFGGPEPDWLTTETTVVFEQGAVQVRRRKD